MARILVYETDLANAHELLAVLRAAGHEAETYLLSLATLPELRGRGVDLIAISLEGELLRANGAKALRALGERTRIIGLHEEPAKVLPQAARAGIAAVLPRPICPDAFLYAVTRTLAHESARAERFST